MRCSSSERLLDAFVEGELEPAVRARVTRHVGACGNCAGILEELRVIDALLITPRRLEPAPNFTFKAMAEIRSLPLPHRHAHRLAPWPVLAAYLLFGWLAIGAFLTFGGTAAHAAVTLLTGSAAQLGAQIVAVAGVTRHVFGGQTFDVMAGMCTLLAVDLVLAALVVVLFAVARTRRLQTERSISPC